MSEPPGSLGPLPVLEPHIMANVETSTS
jgi:hypothetical protein